MICGEAQGTTGACRAGKVGHGACACCWTHGVTPVGDDRFADAVRHSITIRAFQPHWGRA